MNKSINRSYGIEQFCEADTSPACPETIICTFSLLFIHIKNRDYKTKLFCIFEFSKFEGIHVNVLYAKELFEKYVL